MWYLRIIMILVLASSCNPNKRIQRIAKRNSIKLVTVDTITVNDTLERVKTDTIFNIKELELHDTLYIQKDRLKIKVTKVHDSIYVDGECEEVIREVKIPCETQNIIVHPFKKYGRWGLSIILIFILLYAYTKSLIVIFDIIALHNRK